jgi:hypothetical protein
MGIKMPIEPNAVIQDGIWSSGRYQASHGRSWAPRRDVGRFLESLIGDQDDRGGISAQSGWMEAYKRGSHTVWDCKYHVVWVK